MKSRSILRCVRLLLVAPVVASCQDGSHADRPSRARAELRRPGAPPEAGARPGEKPPEWKNLFRTEDGLPRTPSSFLSAKHKALEIFRDHRSTFYCSCTFGEDKSVAAASCGYQPRKNKKRGSRIEWEHIVPAHAFGGHRTCWTEKICTSPKSGKKYRGRKCCGKVDAQFRKMESDLQNLVPAVGELNGDRSNFVFGEIAGEPRAYRACDFEVDFRSHRVEPMASVRGDIARAYLYMHYVYPGGLPLTEQELQTFEQWHQFDPPTDWERTRNRRIAALQGGGNPLVK